MPFDWCSLVHACLFTLCFFISVDQLIVCSVALSLFQVGLTDFGFATPFAPEGVKCTLAYAAPEIIQYILDTRARRVAGKAYTSACDCWSLGGKVQVVLFSHHTQGCKVQ